MNPFDEILNKILDSPLPVEIFTDVFTNLGLEPSAVIKQLEETYDDWDK
jgi:hypothetical protein